ncbi:MAG: GMC family oxidoreductase N-terminal domain-containing protein [Roseibium album]|uniref:Alcohol dehydrogenase [acceptor] n=1 Tax=Roseibium album TaxID=311410 RepID=A0A0M7AC76_9HYPH|nr:GMC family oxidoreductase N-terminal domain-containing protein [Roseibium album]MBG6159385.1 choline dehydrogenase-like flavoprotein [Labrenzia sp. EL_162]MBG6164134.1 choline dehydrogenase-like flavoprotein [Labrenzia sp. EL_195]MBG6198217.1 choline dehydrogenase-like flavoprotein [Labrenzia sp. EL_159]MCR9058834.1 GMC family oxidoreductase N-terminal domain-containing protein [Paracoccaceae bacterium]CTQ57256.1 Alcohol dehydrogenase [acceptor] [Roseibium album]
MEKGYDFIIIGGGSAGSVLAARLTENPDVSVLLLEAGGHDRHPFYHVPAGFAKMTKGIGSWGWQTVPQKHMRDRVFNYTQARVIGGGSAINAQIYTRGNALDYDEWRQMGCDGWGYEDVLPYYRKAEDNDTYNNRYHGQGGPLGVSKPCAPLPICDAYFKAAAELGIPRNEDVTGEKQDGVAYYQLTQKNARRSSAAMAYLAPNRHRKNLHVKTGAPVRRIVVENGTATGVELIDGSRLAASAEVILSSGSIGSPRLLQLSGIGPADHLKDLGIEVVYDQPEVGANLQDHLDLYCICEVSGPHTYDRYAKLHWSALAGLQYLFTRRGPVSSSLFETGGFWYADPEARSPDLQFHLGLGTGIESGVASMPDGGVTLNSCYLRPRSRGSVRLQSANPNDAPLIDPNYLQDPRDREMSIRGLKLTQEILAQGPLEHFIKAERLPGPGVKTDEDYFNFICEHSKTSHHPAGTCRMGPDDKAVLDPRLRFKGLDRLRVIDASVMPTVVSSNTNAAAIMIGEKGADMIRQDHGELQ